jgi:hypothetical protein
VVVDPNGVVRHYGYADWQRRQAALDALDAELLRQEESEVATYADVGRQVEGNKELGEAEFREKRKVGDDELREKRWSKYEIISGLNRMEEEGAEKWDQTGAEYADEMREIRGAIKNVEKEYENGEETQGFVKTVEVWEEETIYEEEYIREENVEEELDFAEDRTKYRPNDDYSHSNTDPQDYDEMVFEIEISVHVHDYTDERIEHPGPGTKPSSQTFEVAEEEDRKENTEVEKREEGNKRESGRYIDVRDKAGEEKVRGMWGFREIGLQEKTEIDVDVKETRIEESMQEMGKVVEGKMEERRVMGGARREGEVEKFEYKEREERGERILEALVVGLEEKRYVDINTGEVHLNEKQLITETMEHVLSGGYARDAVDTYLVGQYMPRGPAGNDQLGSSTNEGVEYSGQAVKGKEVNADVGERDAKGTREVGRKIEENQEAGKEKMKEKLVSIDVETQETTGMGHIEIKKGKRMGEERMQDREKMGKEEEKGFGEAGKERKPFEVQEKCVDTKAERYVGENVEVAQASATYTEERAGEKKSKGQSKLPDDGMKQRMEGDHAQDTKERPQGTYNIKLKLDGSIRVYRYTGRHVRYEESS